MKSQRKAVPWIALVALGLLPFGAAVTAGADEAPVPVIHVTDLHRPHVDPDDHWDLACVFALAYAGEIDLRAVVIDYPPARLKDRNPDVAAIAQMNRITGLAVPVAAGSPHPMKSRDDVQPYASASDHQGVRTVLDVLQRAERPVVIHITGCCRDVAVAGKKAPDLFARKCAAIYLNAGSGVSGAKLEYNVTLGKAAYAAIFDLPCPLYWMPCFEGDVPKDQPEKQGYGTHYAFRQSEILPGLSKRTQNFFLYMFDRRLDHHWLRYLEQEPDTQLLAQFSGKDRHMWCTGGFLHCAGSTVAANGTILPRGKAKAGAVFAFEPISVTCSDEGVTTWRLDRNSANRFIFHVRDRENYPSAVTAAMKSLLGKLP